MTFLLSSNFTFLAASNKNFIIFIDMLGNLVSSSSPGKVNQYKLDLTSFPRG